MYRSVLALLFAAVLLLGGCAAGQQTVPKEKSGQETNMDGAAFDRSDEEITYMDTKDNVIYLAGGCFWGIHDLMDGVLLIRAGPEQQVPLQRLHKIRFQPCALIRFVLRVGRERIRFTPLGFIPLSLISS